MEEEILKLLGDKNFSKRLINELADYFGQTDTFNYNSFIKLMNKLENEGLIARDAKNRYYLSEDLGCYKGVIEINKRGYAFVKVDEEKEFFINEHNLKDAFDKDEVFIQRLHNKNGHKDEAKVLRVIKRGQTRYVGVIKKAKRDYYVDVDDVKLHQKIYVDQAHMHGAVAGSKVVVEIKVFKPKLKGDVVRIIGHVNDPGVDVLSVVYSHDIDIDFPKEVYEEISSIGDSIDESDIKNRVDFRDEMIVTIDGEDAKDLDDAISLHKLNNGHYQLGVHIADVSYYVEENSATDKEAINRGTSIYLVDRVIPMLPHKLCNGICSLNQDVDRYTISCIMEIDQKGEVVDHQIVPSVIRSKHRMTYTNVNKILGGDKELQKEYEDVTDLFFLMKELAQILRKRRDKMGSIDFDVDEAKIILNKKGEAVDVVVRERGESDRIIEEFMLIANETVAQHFKWMELPFIYRVHEYPKENKLRQFQSIIRPLGYHIKGSLDHVYPKELQKIIEASKGTDEHMIISTLLLRCMQKARYDEECLGHFGLSFEYYTHFTSPIRRYPDLLVHRLIRKFLFEERYDMVDHYNEVIPDLAKQSSKREKEAVELEREVDDMKMAEYMSHHIGEKFNGIISSITSFGFFVQLPNTIDGLVHISDLKDDYYTYDEEKLILIGQRTGKQYHISDKVKVRVKACNVNERTIDFELISSKKHKQKNKDINFSNDHYHNKHRNSRKRKRK